MRFALTAFFWLCMATAAQASELPMADPVDEQRASALFYQFRCVMCEAQPIAESHTPMAAQMRSLIREQIAAGRSDAEITSFFAERYGDEILMQPPLAIETLLLWSAPILFISIGGIIAYFSLRPRPESH